MEIRDRRAKVSPGSVDGNVNTSALRSRLGAALGRDDDGGVKQCKQSDDKFLAVTSDCAVELCQAIFSDWLQLIRCQILHDKGPPALKELPDSIVATKTFCQYVP